LGGGGNDAVKNTNTNEIQILFAGYHKPAKLGKSLNQRFAKEHGIAACVRWVIAHEPRIKHKNNINLDSAHNIYIV
jgi:hypothetical protein